MILGLLGQRDRRELIYQFIDIQRAEFPVTTLCRACGVSHSAYYRWNADGRENRCSLVQAHAAGIYVRQTLGANVSGSIRSPSNSMIAAATGECPPCSQQLGAGTPE